VLILAGCGTSSGAPAPAPSKTAASGNPSPGARVTPAPAGSRTGISAPHQPAAPPATPVHLGAGYAAFVRAICAAFAGRNAGIIIGLLPYYQYNSGLRYGMLGDGEGQTGDPGLMRSWLANADVRCRYVSADDHGHGTVLATGWPQAGGSALIDLDTFSGRWKINDFTFGGHGALLQAMQTARPVLPYRG
jgi:hypothetical protein